MVKNIKSSGPLSKSLAPDWAPAVDRQPRSPPGKLVELLYEKNNWAPAVDRQPRSPPGTLVELPREIDNENC